MAIGLTVKREKFQSFKKIFIDEISKTKLDEIIPIINIDFEITSKDIKPETVLEIEKLEPFGEGNKTPIIIYKNIEIEGIRSLSEGKHLKLILRDNNIVFDAIRI